ncbi:penicillin binding transpeptidase domain protein [Orientia chuto str. Dubai]|uniref:Penicillin binding transpeptidase domain protein n=1 Tax=Orientia chuto str. Dubai TaxID=1359168 RepID=A0A0F3MJ97_9RICK|nr:penicillin-binding protein 2 [Candidatus Orientia mediorientalis]KJV55721.1 penicillin binding transpeptidase domain protein [Orientia chuto str. Dubai]
MLKALLRNIAKTFSVLYKTTSFNINYLFSFNQTNLTQKTRILFVILSFLVVFIIIAFRIIKLSTYQSQNLTFSRKMPFKYRKEIVDRNNNILAVNLFAPSITAYTKKITNPALLVKKLQSVFTDIGADKLLNDLKNNKNFVIVKRHLTPNQHKQVYDLGIPGLNFEEDYKRVYTYGNLLSHVLGYVSTDMRGLAGIENYYHSYLSNSEEVLNKPLILSIDIRIQDIVSKELDNAIKKFSALGGVGIIANPNNGEILASISKPDFDPHDPAKATTSQLFNKASLGVYELGSVMHVLTVAIGLDTETITLNNTYDLTEFKISNFKFKDYKNFVGYYNVPEIFIYSSNIGIAKIGLDIGQHNLKKYFKLLALDKPLKIELPEKANSLYSTNAAWSDILTATISYGYSIAISPLHFVQAMIPIVNGGNWYPITLIKRQPEDNFPSQKIFSKKTSEYLNDLLRLTVKHGTTKNSDVVGYLVGGKVGTAKKIKDKKYDKNSIRSSFIGIYPSIMPKFIIYLMLDEPKSDKSTHELISAAECGITSTAARIISKIGALYGMHPHNQEMASVQNIKINNKIQYGIQ